MTTLKKGPQEILSILNNMRLPHQLQSLSNVSNTTSKQTHQSAQSYKNSVKQQNISLPRITQQTRSNTKIAINQRISDDPKFLSHKAKREQMEQERLYRLKQKVNYQGEQ